MLETAMNVKLRYILPVFLAAAFLLGYAAHQPSPIGISASASCESAGAVVSTGYFNNNVEALYYLDSQSGRLSAALVSRADQEFCKTYVRNVKGDLQESLKSFPGVQMPPRPNFIMVSGDSDARNVGAGEEGNLSKSFIYVAETQTGIVMVYIVPQEGDRDLPVEKGDILFWTCARLNPGTGIVKKD